MKIHAEQLKVNRTPSASVKTTPLHGGNRPAFRFTDNRPIATAQRQMQEMVDESPKVRQMKTLREMIDNSPHTKQTALLQTRPGAPSTEALPPIQRRITKAGKAYSFLPQSDLNGNPFLSSRNESRKKETWKIDTAQNDINLTKVNSTAIPFREEDRDRIFHNLSFSRPQEISREGQSGYFQPFKSYQFGPTTRPEIAMYPLEEGEAIKAPLYPSFEKEVKKLLGLKKHWGKKNGAKLTTALSEIYDRMYLLALAEDYRTVGSLNEFIERWNEMLEIAKKWALSMPPKDKEASTEISEELDTAIINCTSKLPFAGTGGKQKGREHISKKRKLANEKSGFQESERPVYTREMTPERDSPGMKWK